MRQPFIQALLRGRLWKFCVVGASSTLIDQVILRILMTAFPPLPLAWVLPKSISFLFSVINGFIWNRCWTFKSDAHLSLKEQFPKFVASNLVGLGLNLLLTQGFLFLFTGETYHSVGSHKNLVSIASLCAVPLVVIWNFSVSRFWTFKTPKAPDSAPIASPQGATKSR